MLLMRTLTQACRLHLQNTQLSAAAPCSASPLLPAAVLSPGVSTKNLPSAVLWLVSRRRASAFSFISMGVSGQPKWILGSSQPSTHGPWTQRFTPQGGVLTSTLLIKSGVGGILESTLEVTEVGSLSPLQTNFPSLSKGPWDSPLKVTPILGQTSFMS